MRKTKPFLIGLFLGFMLGISNTYANVGDSIPQFMLQGLDGEVRSPEDYTNKVVVLFFLGHN